MSKIESRPSKREFGEYIIYIDLEQISKIILKFFLSLKTS